MSTYYEEKNFRHNDDCQMSGCPGHTMKYEYQTTSDSFSVKIDGEYAFSGDIAVLKTFLSLLNYNYLGLTEVESKTFKEEDNG